MKYAYRCGFCEEEEDFDFPVGEAPTWFMEGVCQLQDLPEEGTQKHEWHRVYGLAGLLFKGRGFYTTDNRRFVDVDTSKVPKHLLDR